MTDEELLCDHPTSELHRGRDGSTTVCMKCKRVVQVLFIHFPDGRTSNEQYQAMLKKLDKKVRK